MAMAMTMELTMELMMELTIEIVLGRNRMTCCHPLNQFSMERDATAVMDYYFLKDYGHRCPVSIDL